MQFRYDEIARITGGTLMGQGSVMADGVAIDSRSVNPGDLFVALQGENHDGHAFINSVDSKISGCLVLHPIDASITHVIVEDTTRALAALGREASHRLGARIIAITGSVGKTTTKAMALQILSEQVPGTVGTPGNRNSLLGVPLSFCNFPESAPLAVVEMGMNHAGELDRLGSLFPPDILLYTAIAPVHTAFFPTMEALVEAKAELLAHLNSDGILIVNDDDSHIKVMASRWHGRRFNVGQQHGDLTWRVVEDRGFAGGTIAFETAGHTLTLSRPEGNLHPLSFAQALALALTLGLDPEQAIESLSAFQPPEHRGQLLRRGDVVIVDDSYNASPAAVRQALAAFGRTPVTGRKIFLFGDMYELGDRAIPDHEAVGEEAARSVDHLVTVGSLAASAIDAMSLNGKPFTACRGVEEAVEMLTSLLQAGDWLLVKGSRGVQLERVIESLKVAA